MAKPIIVRIARPVVMATAACFVFVSVGLAQLSQQQVQQYTNDPSLLLQQSGDQLASAVRDLVLANPNLLPAIIALLANASSDQQASVGAGLGQAALASAQTNPDLATQIQTSLAQSGNQTAIASYSATTGNTVTASNSPGTGGSDTGGGAGGGGGVGGPINSSAPTGSGNTSGSSGSGGTTSTGTTGQTSFTGGSVSGGTTLAGGVSGSVSP